MLLSLTSRCPLIAVRCSCIILAQCANIRFFRQLFFLTVDFRLSNVRSIFLALHWLFLCSLQLATRCYLYAIRCQLFAARFSLFGSLLLAIVLFFVAHRSLLITCYMLLIIPHSLLMADLSYLAPLVG